MAALKVVGLIMMSIKTPLNVYNIILIIIVVWLGQLQACKSWCKTWTLDSGLDSWTGLWTEIWTGFGLTR